MGMVFVTLVAIVCGVGLVALFAIGQYNSLVTLRNRYKNSFSEADVQLRARYELIANLVATGRDHLEDERESLDLLVSARNSAYCAGAKAAANPGHPQAIKDLTAAEARLRNALGRFLAMAEANSGLDADRNMALISERLASLENKIFFAAEAYNDAVMLYNVRREVFPANVIAGIFNFAVAEVFLIEEMTEKADSKVSLT